MDEVFENDIGTTFTLTIKNRQGAVVDISGAIVKQLKFTKSNGVVLTKTAVYVTDGTDGKIKYVTVDGDLDTRGIWKVQGYIQLASGSWHTTYNLFTVVAHS